MLYSSIFFAASALSGLAAAQNYTIVPSSVDSTTRANWCRAQTNTCPVLCGSQLLKANTCDSTSLTYSCICNNGLVPDLAEYVNTIPTFECVEYRGQCNSNNVGNATAQAECLALPCGNKTASSLVSATSSAASSTGSASSSSGSVASATSAVASGASSVSASASSAAATGAASSLTVGNGALVASLFGLFAYAL
ncbi:hypothetical protein AUEXF2481DRAFT_43131 [Aureobasidium subglaciale EXF-2481]|uniref:DUF7707 domain-containing protein n=1 Tax=Aureobasidium subglaciale (strain EXF-2481) TaxID=1043005 RepID=A0A074YZM6_AURSE|nr:uncharacterized protein AUEXF2481DRAFT_43131 [Aureobasidium subglaciale EXF-2481]KAI5202236.1 hypothetical protein E4T38_05712 [Aureobasidium subglaciale]KAI5221149.1 hypothetical protein E4T40_05650 [Aureobasidium subglaciale]KAI5224394.1 hypothetical protein E4T41_05691 [Aureobasidium subglaciale]KAI5261036.1 hypothetical protein E4T46_05466 [Aureobasidium subglaciale]KEQ92346.1 hypothetical protein AUEXF2481DRAFT_43131 [Aureobasidium subglaciale EXF-2481]